MAATNKTLVFSAAVRGLHVYRDVWNPHENESWCVCLKQTICLTCLQSEHVVRIVKRQLAIYRERFPAQQNTS